MNRSSSDTLPAVSTASAAPDPARVRAVRARTERLVRVLDNAVGIPGTRIRVGLDALVGLIPGIGDAIGLILGSWFVIEAARVKAPVTVIGRMAGNLLLDAVLGVVPFLGDLLDVAFKANVRNAKLLIGHLDRLDPQRQLPPSRAWLAYVLVIGILALTLLAFYGAWMLLARLWN